MTGPRPKFWGWGTEDQRLSDAEEQARMAFYAGRFGVDAFDRLPVPELADVTLAPPRVAAPAALATLCSDQAFDRVCHSYGKSLPDYVRTFDRDFGCAPDLVAYPRSEDDVAALLDWATGARVAVVPFGGGSSVVGGVEPVVGDGYAATLSLDLRGLDRIVEVDDVSRAARLQAGLVGPALEAALKPHGLTLRHFPQSFAHSTVGGWIATRSAGHFATLYTHIDDLVESVRAVTPAGVIETRRLPGSGAGPSPDRLLIGSEGTLGVITEAWLRLQRRPTHRAAADVRFADLHAAADAIRVVGQAGLYPANLRALDPLEAQINGAGDGSANGSGALVVIAFESADHPVDAWLARALEICADHGGAFARDAAAQADAHRSGAAGAWRAAFIRMPYYRELLTAIGVINDTFETAITWDRFRAFHAAVTTATKRAIEEATGRPGLVHCRFTHIYPDGPAPYFTFHALGRHGGILDAWRHIKTAASDAVIAGGGTITHHHAVGRDHMEWYTQQRPALFGAALAAAKATLDPAGILNPGVLVPAR